MNVLDSIDYVLFGGTDVSSFITLSSTSYTTDTSVLKVEAIRCTR